MLIQERQECARHRKPKAGLSLQMLLHIRTGSPIREAAIPFLFVIVGIYGADLTPPAGYSLAL